MHAHPFGKIKVNNASEDRQVERVRDESSFLILSWNSSMYFKVSSRSLQNILIVPDV